MTRIVLQGKKVYDTFETESVQEIMELHLRSEEEAKVLIVKAAYELRMLLEQTSKMTEDGEFCFNSVWYDDQLKEIDKLAKSIRDNIKFLTAEYTLVDGGETFKIGGKE